MRWTVALLTSFALFAAPVTRAETAVETPPSDATASKATSPQQFLYVLRLVPRLQPDDATWTDADTAAVSRHFEQLKRAAEAGKVILAGRTLEPGVKTFGLVIFEAADESEARRFMESDPAVVAGVMTATLHPYSVALQRRR